MSRQAPVVVQKFGGSSLADLDAIRRVAARIVATRRRGCRVVAVVSAMGETTDTLQKLAYRITPNPQRRELDMLLTAGERQTMALLSLAIMAAGEAAQSFTGSQVGIITDRFHSDARIQEIRGTRLLECLRRGVIPIVAGFQGVSYDREITTLGRGGSDVTAVALAAWLKASRCEFYKDVDGLFTENPDEFPQARPVERISFTELGELAAAGSGVIHPRACALAEKYRVPLVIRSSFTRKRGTVVTHPDKLEKAFVRAITHRSRLARISLIDVRKKRRCLHQVVTRLAKARVPVLLFNHGVTHGTRFDLSFIIPRENLAAARPVIAALARETGAARTEVDDALGSVSVVGPGVGTDAEILSGTLDTLHQAGVHLDAFSTSATCLCCFLPEEDIRLAATALMARFRLSRR
ncbi:MAG: aspartate kinase [candidate division WOR-3 bacterium]